MLKNYRFYILILMSTIFCSKNDTPKENVLLGDWTYVTKDTINLADTFIYVKFDTVNLSFDELSMKIRKNYHFQSLDSLKALPSDLVHTFIISPPPFEYSFLDTDLLELKVVEYYLNTKRLLSHSYYKYLLTNDSLRFYYFAGDTIKPGPPDSLLEKVYIRQ